MDEKLKQRLIGVLVFVGALFIILPFLFHNARPSAEQTTSTAIPTTAPAAAPIAASAVAATLPAENTVAAHTPAAQPAALATTATPVQIQQSTSIAQSQSAKPQLSQPQMPSVSQQKSPAATTIAPVITMTRSENIHSHAVVAHADASGFKPDQSVSPTSGLTTGAPISVPPDNQAPLNNDTVAPVSIQSTADIAVSRHHAAHHHAHALKRISHHAHAASGQHWTIQLAVFSNERNAKKLMAKLHAHHFAAHTRRIVHHGRHMTAVFVGPEYSHQKTLALQHRLHRELHMSGVVKSV